MKCTTLVYCKKTHIQEGRKQAVFTLQRVKSWFLHTASNSKTSAHGVVFLILDLKFIIAEWKQVTGYYQQVLLGTRMHPEYPVMTSRITSRMRLPLPVPYKIIGQVGVTHENKSGLKTYGTETCQD